MLHSYCNAYSQEVLPKINYTLPPPPPNIRELEILGMY